MGDKFKLVLKIEERFNAGNAQRKVFGKIKGRPNKNIEVIHHSGVKGMKWGVRNGPPYTIKNNGKVAKGRRTLHETHSSGRSYNNRKWTLPYILYD